MTWFHYPRLMHLLYLIKSENLPQDELAQKVGVSTRTIRTDIVMLNRELSNYGALVERERGKGKGYKLTIYDENQFSRLDKERLANRFIPRSVKERIALLQILFLTTPNAVNLEDLGKKWCVSRGTLQTDLVAVRETLAQYQLALVRRPRYGMVLLGTEPDIRSCLTDLIWQEFANHNPQLLQQVNDTILNTIDFTFLDKTVRNSVERFDLHLTDEHLRYLIVQCAVLIIRITNGQELLEFEANLIPDSVIRAVADIGKSMSFFLGGELSLAEQHYLCVQFAARTLQVDTFHSLYTEQHSSDLANYLIDYIDKNYNYNLKHDDKLQQDLTAHLHSMLTRIHYQIYSPNPLLSDIKKYYPFAYDVALSAIAHSEHYLPNQIGEDEIGYLAVHIGVALERHYNVGYTRRPYVLLVSDSGNSTIRVIEAKIKKEFPHIYINQVISLREYERLSHIQEDFVITTVRLMDKDKPIVKIDPFPTAYQLEQLGCLAMVDRTKPYILESFFDERFFLVIDEPTSQNELFAQVCQKLVHHGFVNDDFYSSLLERESIVSTLLGDNIAIPHSLGLLANKTTVVTILAPHGISWGKEKNELAKVIFLLAISKDEYEEAMAIYDLFVAFVREKATKRLLESRDFFDFQMIAKDSLARAGEQEKKK